MKYLVTGATGFIGRFLVERLLARRSATVYVLMRRGERRQNGRAAGGAGCR